MVDFDAQRVISGFNLRAQRHLDQVFERVNFGSDLENGWFGSAGSFRASDSPAHVSKVLTEFPSSYINENPEEVEAIRKLHGLDDDAKIVPTLSTGTEGDTLEQNLQTPVNENGVFGSNGWFSGLTGWFESKAVNFGVLWLAGIMVLGGLIIIAFQSDTVKNVAKDVAKTAVV